MKCKVAFELETGSDDLSDVLDGITQILAENFPSGLFYGGTSDVDEDSISVEEVK